MKKFASRTIGQRALASVLSVSLVAAGMTSIAPAASAQPVNAAGGVNVSATELAAQLQKGITAKAGSQVNYVFSDLGSDVKATVAFKENAKFNKDDFKNTPFSVNSDGALVIDLKKGDSAAGNFNLPSNLEPGNYTLNANVEGFGSFDIPLTIVKADADLGGTVGFSAFFDALAKAFGNGNANAMSGGDTLKKLIAQAGSITGGNAQGGSNAGGDAQGGSNKQGSSEQAGSLKQGSSNKQGSSEQAGSLKQGSSKQGSSSSLLPILGAVIGLGIFAAVIGSIINFLMNKAPAPMPMPAPAPAPAPAPQPELPAKDGHPVANPVHAAKDGHPVANPVH